MIHESQNKRRRRRDDSEILVHSFPSSPVRLHITLLMASLALFLLFSLASISSLPLSTADEPIFQICNKERNYTANGTFQENLAGLIASLSASTPAAGFAKDTAGQVPNRAYGLAICRGDVGAAGCRRCLAGAAQDAAAACPGNKAATIFYELCHLRYSDEDFFGTSTDPQFLMWNVNNVSDVAAFNRALGALLDNLTARAAASARMFAAGSADYDDFTKVYALLQCTRDLSRQTCDSCLRYAIVQVPLCCAAKQGARVISSSCYLRYEVAPFFNASAASDPPALSPTASLPNNTSPPLGSPVAGDNKINTLATAVGVSIGVAVSLSILATIGICLRKRRQRKPFGGTQEDDTSPDYALKFTLETLKRATMNFSDQNKLGEGGFGIVYKGVLADGQSVAVKRLVASSGEGLKELKNEVCLVAKLQHRNLVRFLGYCLHAQENILVYEYLANKSLDKFLFDPARSKLLTWEKRVKIIEGVARGLLYLHEDSRLKIIHRDLKASNVLLDEGMNPKIADFGLARLFGNEQSYGSTQRIAGTHGYMAPEYMMHGQISTKSDVYSFGVLLLEIITGRKCTGFHGFNPPTDLISYIWRLWEEGSPLEVLDKGIVEGFSSEEVLRRIHVGLLCVQHDPLERPNMAMVVLLLSSGSSSLPVVSPLSGFSETSRSISDPLEHNALIDNTPMPRPIRNGGYSLTPDNMAFEPRSSTAFLPSKIKI